jgi:hypothetical protein
MGVRENPESLPSTRLGWKDKGLKKVYRARWGGMLRALIVQVGQPVALYSVLSTSKENACPIGKPFLFQLLQLPC